MTEYLSRDALFDDPVQRTYRYWLARRWSRAAPVLFIMLNPSIGDESRDSRTLARCRAFAEGWGYGGLDVCNLFAFVDQRNDLIHRVHDPVGPRNDEVISETVNRVVSSGGMVVAGWGCDGVRLNRDAQVIRLVTAHADLMRIGPATRDGHPRHPLYLSGDLRPALHRGRALDSAARRHGRADGELR